MKVYAQFLLDLQLYQPIQINLHLTLGMQTNQDERLTHRLNAFLQLLTIPGDEDICDVQK